MYYVNRDVYLPVLLNETVTYEDIQVSVLPSSGVEFSDYDLVETDLVSVSNGYYMLRVPGTKFPHAGIAVVRIETPTQVLNREIGIMQPVIDEAVPANVCRLVGNIKDIAGRPPEWDSVEVMFWTTGFPRTHGASFIKSGAVRDRTDINGNFNVPCLRGSTIVFEIPACGLRVTYDVPLDLDVINMVDVYNTLLAS